MARPSKLTTSQCAQIRALKVDPVHPVPAPALAKKFKVSESSIYKVLDGSYVARPDEVPQIAPSAPQGGTPSIFGPRPDLGYKRAQRPAQPVSVPTVASLLEQAAKSDLAPVDELTLAAAELVLARARLSRMLAASPA